MKYNIKYTRIWRWDVASVHIQSTFWSTFHLHCLTIIKPLLKFIGGLNSARRRFRNPSYYDELGMNGTAKPYFYYRPITAVCVLIKGWLSSVALLADILCYFFGFFYRDHWKLLYISNARLTFNVILIRALYCNVDMNLDPFNFINSSPPGQNGRYFHRQHFLEWKY